MSYEDLIKFGIMLFALCFIPLMLIFLLGYKREKRIFWIIIFDGVTAPWLVGILVKIYLQNQGKPTYPWSYFLNPTSLAFMLTLTVWFSLPFFALAFLHRFYLSKKPFAKLSSDLSKFLLMLFTAAGGIIGICITFTAVFWQFNLLYFFIPLWMYYLPFMVIGSIIGIFAGRYVEARNRNT